jgi:hypothetical protein
MIINQLFDNLLLCIIDYYYSQNIDSLTSAPNLKKKKPTQRLYKKSISGQDWFKPGHWQCSHRADLFPGTFQ